jgi:hypothetical protein
MLMAMARSALSIACSLACPDIRSRNGSGFNGLQTQRAL